MDQVLPLSVYDNLCFSPYLSVKSILIFEVAVNVCGIIISVLLPESTAVPAVPSVVAMFSPENDTLPRDFPVKYTI